MARKNRTPSSTPNPINPGVNINEIPRPQFVRPAEILPGTEEERFARHRHRFVGGTPEEFDLKSLNWARGWCAFKKYYHDLMEYHEALKHVPDRAATDDEQSQQEALSAPDSTIACRRNGAVLEESRDCSAMAGDGGRFVGSQTGRKLHLVYRESEDGISLIFTSPERAVEIDRLRRALETAETWGEFRRRIGPEAHAELFGEDFDASEFDDDSEDIDANPSGASADAPFDSYEVPGYADGDYPPWLSQEIDKYVPPEILERYATHHESVFNGSSYKIDPKHRNDIVKELTEVGFTVEEREDLEFW